MNTFIQVLFGLTKVLTVLQCSFMSPYTNSQIYSLRNIFPMASRFLHRTDLPTHRSAYQILALFRRSGRCWACLSTVILYTELIEDPFLLHLYLCLEHLCICVVLRICVLFVVLSRNTMCCVLPPRRCSLELRSTRSSTPRSPHDSVRLRTCVSVVQSYLEPTTLWSSNQHHDS